MTDEEKLRALLAEARDGLFDEGEEVVHHLLTCPCWACNLARRIDAALAEPVGGALEWQTAITKALSESQERLAAEVREARRERDEARAEVERLSTWGPLKRLHTEMEAEVKAAYQRGAEAMREASMRVCNEASFGWGADDIAEELRALPLPEDKP